MKNQVFRNIYFYDGKNLPSGNGELLFSFRSRFSEMNRKCALLDARKPIEGGGTLVTTWTVFCGRSKEQPRMLFEKERERLLFIKVSPAASWSFAVRGGDDKLLSTEGSQSLDKLFEEFVANDLVLTLP